MGVVDVAMLSEQAHGELQWLDLGNAYVIKMRRGNAPGKNNPVFMNIDVYFDKDKFTEGAVREIYRLLDPSEPGPDDAAPKADNVLTESPVPCDFEYEKVEPAADSADS